MNFKRFLVSFLSFFLINSSFGLTSYDTLYINRGIFNAYNGVTFDYLAFNESIQFDQENKRVILALGDTIQLTIINNDTVVHGFAIKDFGIPYTINPGSDIQVEYYSLTESATIFYDPIADFAYLGLAGMIVTTNHNKNFFWNMKDHQSEWNDLIAQGGLVNWNDYYPDYYTINGKSNPNINLDANARVTGAINDTIHIYMVNTGQSIHSIHFHGYHLKVLQSTKNPEHVNRIKDTFPVDGMELIKLELIPHQNGEYPVHDHNLVAVSGGQIYPNGMFLTILIQ